MRDLFFEAIALQRIELVTRLVSLGKCEAEDRALVVDWVAELSADLVKRLDEYEKQNPQDGGDESGGLLQ
ncbi:hypothetical protein ACMV8I_06205 [Ewingella sp. S1.OA.A_B6]